MNQPITDQLKRAMSVFAHYEQPLTDEQGQQAISLMREIETALHQIPTPVINPLFEAALVQLQEPHEQRPILFVDGMNALFRAREQTETLLLMGIAFAPRCRSQEDEHMQQRRAMTAAMRRLAETLEKISAFAPASSQRARPDHLRIVAPTPEEDEPEA
jgi:hypothetical protein